MKSLKVIYVTHYGGFYGANKSLLQLILELRENHGVLPLVLMPLGGKFVAQLEKHGIEYRIIKHYNWLNVGDSQIKSLIKRLLNNYYFFRSRKVVEGLHTKFSLIHTNTSVSPLGGYLSSKLVIPHIWHLREFGKEDFNAEYYCGIVKAGRYIQSHSNKVVVISKSLQKYYSKYISTEKIQVVYNGIKYDEAFQKDFNETGPLRIVFVGVITSNKNQMEAVRACNELVKDGVHNFTLSFLGDGPDGYIDEVKAFVKKNKLQDKISFLGFVDDVNKVLDSSDVGLVCSNKEAFGRVTIEFMMRMLPVIVSNTGVNPELVEHERAGFVYQHKDFESLANYIKFFIKNRDALKKMGVYAHQLAGNKFSSRKNSQEIYQLYLNAINSH